jgi:hypothetical protein
MLLLNFAHELFPEDITAVEAISGQTVSRLIERLNPYFDVQRSYEEQARELVDSLQLEPDEWRPPILVNLPSFGVITALVLADIHGRLGHFPAVLRLRPVKDAKVRQFEVAEIIDVEAIRDKSRKEERSRKQS